MAFPNYSRTDNQVSQPIIRGVVSAALYPGVYNGRVCVATTNLPSWQSEFQEVLERITVLAEKSGALHRSKKALEDENGQYKLLVDHYANQRAPVRAELERQEKKIKELESIISTHDKTVADLKSEINAEKYANGIKQRTINELVDANKDLESKLAKSVAASRSNKKRRKRKRKEVNEPKQPEKRPRTEPSPARRVTMQSQVPEGLGNLLQSLPSDLRLYKRS